MSIPSPAQALWKQRHRLASLSSNLRSLMKAVDKSIDFSPFQWATVTAFALEFQPDLVIELGRDRGNSTCCFLEAAHLLRGTTPCKVISLDLINNWTTITMPRLQKICPPEWFAPAEIIQGDILRYDVTRAVEKAKRCLVFWDAHGFEIAEWVLGHLLPRLQSRSHVVLMHDLSDRRYCSPSREYGTRCFWKSEHPTEHSYWFGHICSRVGQAVSIIDFASRNDLPLHSTDESLFTELWNDPGKKTELERMLGEDMFSLNAHWFWFSLNEATGPLVFPRYEMPVELPAAPGTFASQPGSRDSRIVALLRKVLRRAG